MADQSTAPSAGTAPKEKNNGNFHRYFTGGVCLTLAAGMLVTLSLASDLSHFTWLVVVCGVFLECR